MVVITQILTTPVSNWLDHFRRRFSPTPCLLLALARTQKPLGRLARELIEFLTSPTAIPVIKSQAWSPLKEIVTSCELAPSNVNKHTSRNHAFNRTRPKRLAGQREWYA